MALQVPSLLRPVPCLRKQFVTKYISFSNRPLWNTYRRSILRRVFSDCTKTFGPRTGSGHTKKSLGKVTLPPVKVPHPDPTLSRARTYADVLFHHGDEILLYRCANHRAFIVFATTVGLAFLYGAYSWALIVFRPPPPESGQETKRPSRLIYLMSGFSTLFFIVFGSAAILAPAAMIRSIVLRAEVASNGSKTPVLQFKVRSLPLGRTKTIEAHPWETYLNRKVSTMDINWNNAVLSQARSFTESMKSQKYATPVPSADRGIARRFWDVSKREIQRTFLRDGFTYVRFQGGQTWKLDLQQCDLLENGRPLERLMMPDKDPVGVMPLIKRRLFI